VLDPRVAYIITNMMEEVMRSGTAAGARAVAGFNVPAAGKTGTSRDGWFAGFTSELLCVVWVGFDDAKELDIEGARSAAPIWMEFMKDALKFREYRDTRPFEAPDGIVTIDIDPLSEMPATPSCPKPIVSEVYIAGTQPVGFCPLHGGRTMTTTATGWDTLPQEEVPAPRPAGTPGDHTPHVTGTGTDGQLAPAATQRRSNRQNPPDTAQNGKTAADGQPKKEEKPSLLRRFLNVIK